MAKKNTSSEIPHSTEMECLQATHVQVYILKDPVGKTRAFARVVLNEQMQLTGLRVVDGSNGLFVSYPNDPNYKGEDYRSLFYPITKDLRERLEQAVLEEYQNALHPDK
ncbi:MAG TPA: SpoVG family protein [Fibrobacteraceae bacterium]|nr:SpoVG family protein [Fibrobacteraceae bacterium]